MAGLMRVFIVEDSRTVRSMLVKLLPSIGPFDVVGQAFGEITATEWLQKNGQGWDVAIVDLMLEDGSGFGVLRRCKQANPNASVVAFSEFATPVLKAKCIALGASAAFHKSELPAFKQYLAILDGGGSSMDREI